MKTEYRIQYLVEGKNLNRAYIRTEGNHQSAATWRFSLVLFTLIASCIVAGAVEPQMPRVWEMMMEPEQ
jgi:hypothetical protein